LADEANGIVLTARYEIRAGKYNHWEQRIVPVRVEWDAGTRCGGVGDGETFQWMVGSVPRLVEIQSSMFQAQVARDSHVVKAPMERAVQN
jgi:hypothetical protein